MREMKDSGIEWIGEIPKDWEEHPVYVYFEEGKTKNYRMQEQNLLSLSYGRIIRKDINTNVGLLPASFNTYNVVEAGDIIIRPTDLQNDKRSLRTGLVKEQGIITSAYIDLRPKDNVNSKYYHYLLHSYDIIKVFYNMGNGVRQGLNFSEFAKLLLLEPTTVEQQQIADYLDTQCSEIDATAEDIQKEISLLEEYKKSVITEAVTKGLNPDAEMKDSGIKWLPKIPMHWKVIPSKYLFANSDIRRQTGDEQLTASQKYGIITQKDYTAKENAQIVLATQGLEKWKHVEPNDFIISLRSFQGGLEMSEITGCITWHYVVLKAQKEVCHKYYKWLFKSARYINALQGTCNFIRDGQDLRFSNFALVPLFELPLAEQQQIADFLDSKCSEIDSLIADKKRQLDILADYKKSLIYEYVTGKKEVPVNE